MYDGRKEAVFHLLEVVGFDGAFGRDLDAVLLAGPVIDDGEGALDVRGRRDPGGGGEAERVEERGGVGGGGGEQVSSEGGQTVACSIVHP